MADKTDTPTGADLEKQLDALREDFAGIAKLLKSMAEDRADTVADRARSTAEDLSQEASRRGREARDAVEDAARGHPLATLGIAVALGFALGLFTRR